MLLLFWDWNLEGEFRDKRRPLIIRRGGKRYNISASPTKNNTINCTYNTTASTPNNTYQSTLDSLCALLLIAPDIVYSILLSSSLSSALCVGLGKYETRVRTDGVEVKPNR